MLLILLVIGLLALYLISWPTFKDCKEWEQTIKRLNTCEK